MLSENELIFSIELKNYLGILQFGDISFLMC